MKDLFKLLLGVLASLFKSRATLEAEILVLRQQINVLRRRMPKRPDLNNRDTSYGPVFMKRLRAMGIRDQPIAFRSPWQNAYVERLIGSIRRGCLDHMIVFGEAHPR